ncbi:helix-turn-helix domain-containing protein [Patescibacteria group bacterium]|nr:helix-turn-helix domain-containing protein [Patescibacteria group bacterium]
MKYFSTQQTAKILGYNDDSYVRQLIRQGHLKAVKIGKSWGVSEKSLHQLRIKNTIKNRFKLLLSYNYELRTIIDGYMDKPFSVDSEKRAVAQMFLGKSYKTHDAAITLCEKGFGEDAAIITRSLFENFINLKYILSVEDDGLATRYMEFDFVLQKTMLDYFQKKPNLLKILEERESRPKPDDTDIKTINKKSKEVIKKHNFDIRTGWSGKTIKKMASSVGRLEQWETIYRLQCQLSHPSPRGMNGYFSKDEDGLVMDVGRNENYVEESLISAFDFFGSTIDIVGDLMNWDTEKELSSLLERFKTEVEESSKKIN